ncbi:MAG TPA: oxidoreductase-like domain-containing protein [Luteimonas sp.]|nr:oxidoreductase-like domain-containing protein [Luteimonas sp.]
MAVPILRAAVTPDPPPIPPEKPLPSDCCEGGCDRCVFDLYAEELAQYEAELAAWRARNPGCDPAGAPGGQGGR